MDTTRFDRITALTRRALAGAALAALLAGAGASARPAAAAGCGSCDDDRDGLTNYEEYAIYGTDAYNGDTDGDIIADSWEIFTYGTDPLAYDTAH